MFRILVGAFAVVFPSLGCSDLGVDPSGKLACSQSSHACPSGYLCNLADNRCWREGALPADGGLDRDGPTSDMPARSDGSQSRADVAACSEAATRTCDRDGLFGKCASGTETCTGGHWGPCSISPATADRCDVAGDDSTCDGKANDGCTCMNGAVQPCGPSVNMGICKRGTQTCANGTWGACTGATFGKARDCTSALDNDCDGKPDNTADDVCQCSPVGGMRACGTHPQDGVGACHAGAQTCIAAAGNAATSWSECAGAVGPAATDGCSPGDDSNCNGTKNEGCTGAKLEWTPAVGSQVAFGTIPVGTDRTQTFVLTNTGQMSSSAVTISLTGVGFSLVPTKAGDCVSGTTALASGASCTVSVKFAVSTAGDYEGTLSASATTGGTSLPLMLTAFTPAYCGDGVVSVPEKCDLGAGKNTGTYNGCTANCTLGPRCGDAIMNDASEECDLGTTMNTATYGGTGCTATCTLPPRCGDNKINGPEICDNGSSNGLVLNACNPECSGTVGVKLLKVAPLTMPTFGGVAGADSICKTAFGATYKAVMVDASNRVAGGPGGQQKDWVLKKFTLYRNGNNEDVFVTDGDALLGVRMGLHATLTNSIYGYSGESVDDLQAWASIDSNWNYRFDVDNCSSYMSADPARFAGTIWLGDKDSSFPNNNGVRYCNAPAHILCAQQ